MPRIYADLPRFKRIHQALMEAARRNDAVMQEIDNALACRRSSTEQETLHSLRSECEALRQQYPATLRSFVRTVTEE